MQVFLLALASLAAWLWWWTDSRRRRRGGKPPPGPPSLPIVGNIFQLGQNPHKSFAHLAKTYGPLMSLHLGSQFAVVVSSPEAAAEVLQKQGLLFAKPFNPRALCILGHDEHSIFMLPASSDVWKKLRRVVKEKLFSNQALQASQELRRERMRELTGHVGRCSGEGRAMNVGEATFTTMSNLIFATLFSVEFAKYGGAASDSGDDAALKEHVHAVARYIGLPNIADCFPIFAPLDPQGLKRKLTHHLGGLLEIVQTMIDRRLQERKAAAYHKRNDFLETLLDLMEGDEYDLSIKETKHLFVVSKYGRG